jgi:membrane-associated phospholipid phosphatase
MAITAALLVAGIIAKHLIMRQNALYAASSKADTAVINALIKKIIWRPHPFITNIHLTAIYQPTYFSFPAQHTSSALSSATVLFRLYQNGR